MAGDPWHSGRSPASKYLQNLRARYSTMSGTGGQSKSEEQDDEAVDISTSQADLVPQSGDGPSEPAKKWSWRIGPGSVKTWLQHVFVVSESRSDIFR